MAEELEFKINVNTGITNLIRTYILNELNEPVILNKFLYRIKEENWGCINWDINEWLNILRNETYKIQFGRRISASEVQDSPQWEHLNLKGYMTFSELLEWEKGKKSCTTTCNTPVSHSKYWAYLDYYYMRDLSNLKLIDENLSWASLGFPEIKANDSTLWIGTTGANTPCHIDTYGINIVCQIYGKKRWTLFPKDQSSNLYSTRVPYEESSIYSAVEFPKPNIKKFPKLDQTTPYVVTLEVGDVLLVPKHWWHFVENLELAISINTWVPLPSDPHDRLKEALVLYHIGSLCQSVCNPSLLKNIFNDNMMEQASLNSSELLDSLKNNITNYLMERKAIEQNSPTIAESRKKLKTDHISVLNNSFSKNSRIFKYVKKYTFKEYCSLINIDYATEEDLQYNAPVNLELQYDMLKLLINTFTDDRVISILKTVLEENLQQFP